MKLRFLRGRLEELDTRVEDARRRAQAATREAELSRRREMNVRKNIVEPLLHTGKRNQFAELIRAAIVTGHHRDGSV